VPGFCCFTCPSHDYEIKTLEDLCPACQKPYGFPKFSPPVEIGEFRDLEFLGRGFYAGTYKATYGNLGDRVVLKIAPVAVYSFFGKDFAEECRLHKKVAEGSEHLVGIRDRFEADVRFGTEVISCHVAVLNYVEGASLARFVAGDEHASPESIAQVSIDLFRLLLELKQAEAYHNDLHDENIIIERLGTARRRPEAIDDSVRAVAIDLGSMAEHDSRDSHHIGDIEAVTGHLYAMAARLVDDPANGDTEYRLASVLDDIWHALAPDAVMQRAPDYEDMIRRIREVFDYVASPWRRPQSLHRFADAYNAQTLAPGFIPRLLVDPDDQWLDSVSVRGPQVVTGMRGCGKTMLLRALQFHARVEFHLQESNPVLESLAADGYVGLYASCNRLLDALGSEQAELHEPYARLFVAYAREAIHAQDHLRTVDGSAVPGDAHSPIAEICAAHLGEAKDLRDISSPLELERRLQRILMSLDRGEDRYRLLVNPALAFPDLAERVIGSTPVWAESQVLFLLDDVSTRHLQKEPIAELLSTLLFSNPLCAFKMTTEVQTLELVLRSPGQVERARAGRDYIQFDLGAAVNAKLRDHRSTVKGKEFIVRILEQRARQYRRHPDLSPKDILGDATLKSIAEDIASSKTSSREDKSVYHGLTALTALCVGDIGDVISIYELILRKSLARHQQPASRVTQSECMQEYCARRLYNVSRRDNRLKDFALSFAGAAHDLLVRSYREEVDKGHGRLRQYTSLYVKLSTDATSTQYEQIRELVDAGVFVLEGGTDTPRMKASGRDPVQQFVLTYRKLFGLSSYVGLAERDRFELSGADLAEWLDNPSRGKEILLRHLGGPLDESAYEEFEDDEKADGSETPPSAPSPPDAQLGFDIDAVPIAENPDESETAVVPMPWREPSVRKMTDSELVRETPDVLVLGLGFEERTLASARRLMAIVKPASVVLVRYPEAGHGAEIEELARRACQNVTVVDYESITEGRSMASSPGLWLVDVTGLAKAALFHAVHSSLDHHGRTLIAHTKAERYYPLDDDIGGVLRADQAVDTYTLLGELERVWPGEEGPYRFVKLLADRSDGTRQRVLSAAATAKAERLLTLLDEREYDAVHLVVPDSESPRSQLARLAAQVADPDGTPEAVESDDLAGQMDSIARQFQRWHMMEGLEFEMGLTGSKMHGVACAAASAAFPVAQAWYVAPTTFDAGRFTEGIGESVFYELMAGGTAEGSRKGDRG
jgi:hypothetical protein